MLVQRINQPPATISCRRWLRSLRECEEIRMEQIISFGRWLKLRRQALRLTQDTLAGLVFCSVELIRKIEADARRPSPEIAERLARHLSLAPHQWTTFVKVARAEL